jgi:anti-sigma regulatory factor (Ser/Thr protein kinase)
MTELAGLERSRASDMGVSCQWLAPALRMAALASGNWPLSARPGAGWTCFPRLALRTPGTDARSVGAGRDFTIATMHRWGAGERSDDAAVVVSELLTNALRHALPDAGRVPAQGAVRLALLQPGRSVICAVADPSPKAPVPRDPGLLCEGGRGLHVISALADSWGCTPPSRVGKVVWAVFSVKHPDGPVRLVGTGPETRRAGLRPSAGHSPAGVTAGSGSCHQRSRTCAGSPGPRRCAGSRRRRRRTRPASAPAWSPGSAWCCSGNARSGRTRPR